jgi:phosphohistidine swiveling domain-containing protein
MEKIPAIVGAEGLDLRDESGGTVVIFRQDHAPQHQLLRKLEALTLDLDSGKVYDGALPPCDQSWIESNPPA